ncbi:GTPase HflX [Salimicrobium halophilum]|uniref:GTPase HflX n=1 Tax=Salimicrobium halophilum TaxID=86666 RepID=A0A1G8Q685_9BACI|nr:GTPase HflX [Salimicrobium halophilum]SDJ00272.1 GTP-binding protein HflX [Salimicrobium halophilum]
MEREKVLILAMVDPFHKERFRYSLDELKALTDTAGGEVKHVLTQQLEKPHAGHYVGTGKLVEAKELIDQEELDLVVINDELSPTQLRNITNKLEVRVIDRSQLILDIFAYRAKTKEGKLQVELAQLQYLLPRLAGQGAEMSRLGGGIGTRGPGETKLETDRRHIRRRINDIKRRLQQVVEHRNQYRERRKENKAFQVAIVGYTNAGKTTFFNKITTAKALQENQLFATLDPLTRQTRLPSGLQVLISDTVGFIQHLPTTLIAAFRSTLEEVTEADFILHVVDASHPDHENHEKTVLSLLEELEAEGIPRLTVYNKQDKVSGPFTPMEQPSVNTSFLKESGTGDVLSAIENVLRDVWEPYHTYVSAVEGKFLKTLELNTLIEVREYMEEKDSYVVRGYVDPEHPLRNKVIPKESRDE